MDDLPLLNPPDFPDCLVCGPANPEGLHLRIHRDGTDAVARYTPRATQIGYPERVHGGLIGMLVDEMLVYAGAPHGLWGMTAKVRYWLRRPIPVGAELTLRGRLVQRSERGLPGGGVDPPARRRPGRRGRGDVRHPRAGRPGTVPAAAG